MIERINRQHIDRRLLVRLRLFITVLLVKTGLVIFSMVSNEIAWPLTLAGISTGIVIGALLSRIYKLDWDENSSQVIAQIDWMGGIFLLIYIAFRCSQKWFWEFWIDSGHLVAFALCVSTGIMFGRVLLTRRGIKRILESLNRKEESRSI